MDKVSVDRVSKVKKPLQDVYNLAASYAEADGLAIRISEGMRTLETQKEYVKKGVSQTLNSKHLTGDAIDVWLMKDGKLLMNWKDDEVYKCAEYIFKACRELKINLKWGGAWKRIADNNLTPQEMVSAYKKNGGKFLDGPHFEI